MALASYVPLIQARVPTVPDNVALLELRESARKFLRRSGVWVETVTLSSEEDTAEYAISSSDLVETSTPVMLKIISVTKDGTELPTYAYHLDASISSLVFEDNFVPTEDGTDDLEVVVTFNVSFGDSEIPDFVEEKYVDAIIGGAIYAILNYSNRPYSNPSASRGYKTDFDRGIVQARRDLAESGYGGDLTA